MMVDAFRIGNRMIGQKNPVYIIAEMSANHNNDLNVALELVNSAKEAGVDAIKLQTYTPDTLTIDCKNAYFNITKGTIWEGKTLYDLYGEAYTPWEWHYELQKEAHDLGLDFFSTPFDPTSVDFLEKLQVPAYKIASFEIVDIPLIRKIARTKKPIILSTGMATVHEIEEALKAIFAEGNEQVALLKCTSAYPARPEEMNLRTIPHMADQFNVPVGLSDHTLGIFVPVTAVALGACIIEKHLTLSRFTTGPDSTFSLEPAEFKAMVDAIRETEQALGDVSYTVSEDEMASRIFRRSLFVIRDMKKGEIFTVETIRSIRPGYGLAPKYLEEVLGKKAVTNIKKGTPLDWNLVE